MRQSNVRMERVDIYEQRLKDAALLDGVVVGIAAISKWRL
jgi:hypothetical protein